MFMFNVYPLNLYKSLYNVDLSIIRFILDLVIFVILVIFVPYR